MSNHVNTFEHPDKITIMDKEGYVGGTEDATGLNVSAITLGTDYNVLDSRSKNGFVRVTGLNTTGKITLTVITLSTYLSVRTGQQERNPSQYKILLYGNRMFTLYLPWSQKNNVEFNKKNKPPKN